VKSASPEWFWRQEIARPFDFIADTWDVGCVQTTSLDVEADATRQAFVKKQAENALRRESEGHWLESVGARAIVCDVASFPLTLAHLLGIPGILVANFTWADIYAEYEGFEEISLWLREEYAQASVLLQTDLALPMAYCKNQRQMGLVARGGTARRERFPTDKRLALIYAGSWGLPFPWERLGTFPDWHFLTLTPPREAVPNLTILTPTEMAHSDLVASVDCVVSKLGYGILGECLANGTPIVYPPRRGFAEFAALEAGITDWEGGRRLSEAEFLGVEWGSVLANIPARGTLTPQPAPGGAAIAAYLAELVIQCCV
jgi:L-arabinokinase